MGIIAASTFSTCAMLFIILLWIMLVDQVRILNDLKIFRTWSDYSNSNHNFQKIPTIPATGMVARDSALLSRQSTSWSTIFVFIPAKSHSSASFQAAEKLLPEVKI